MKTVQFITRSDTIGGAQKYILETSKSFGLTDNDVTIVAGGSGEFSKAAEKLNLQFISLDTVVREFSFLDDLKSILRFRRIIREISPDMVFLHSAKAGLIGRLALIGLSPKKVFIAHGWSHVRSSGPLRSFIFRAIEKFLSYFCSKIVCISNADIDFAITRMKIARNKIEFIPTGVTNPNFTPQKRSTGTLKILTVTRFQEPKDFDTLLNALNEISNLDWELSVVGDGPDMVFYQEKVNASPVSKKIRFHGFQKDLRVFYSSCDVVVLISKSEGLPISLIEAMSYRRPLISTDVGGVSDLIVQGLNGFLVPSGNAKKLASTIAELVSTSASDFDKMGNASYQIYCESFNFEAMMRKLESLY